MKIISIDPGYDRIGVAILEKPDQGKEHILFSTCITTNKKETFYERMDFVQKSISELITNYQPELMVVEQLYFAKNTTTALHVAEAKGIITGIGLSFGLSIHELHPNHIKIAITGHGGANKKDILWMIPKLIDIDPIEKLDDELDAVAIGIAFFAHHRHSQLMK